MNRSQPDTGRTIAAVVLIGLGLLFLFGQTFNFSLFGALWPLFILLPGAAFLYFAVTGGRNQAGLAVPGSLIGGTGAILLYQNLTGHWESWAYAWLLYPVFLGLALQFMGRRTGDEGTYNTGSGFVRFGGTAFLIAAAIFELMIFGGGGFLGGLALPLVLIGLGALMLFRGNAPRLSSRKSKNDDAPVFTGARLVNTGNSTQRYSDPELQRRIDEALADDTDEKPKNG
ncbi:MAG: hypothetical protein HZC41_09730 [Chloroflexi bacterium]|nr:hypothetical protein [Chloroflexota bacterium]